MNLETAIQTSKFTSESQKAILNVLYTAWWLKTIVSQELKKLGLTHEQYNVLRILKGKHPETMCVKDIGCRMIERSSNVPRIIDKLVVKKLVERSASNVDKRETSISLTESGIAALKTATEIVDGLFAKTIDLDAGDAADLSRILEKIRENE